MQDPEAGDRLPLVGFSQELGADKPACAVISQRVAENGYVIVHPDHGDGFGRSGFRQGVHSGNACAGGIGEPRSAGGQGTVQQELSESAPLSLLAPNPLSSRFL